MVASSAPAPARRLLLVDDNRALVDNLREILEDAGYAVRAAASCAEARAFAEDGGFHVALVDLRLPDGDGTVLAATLREQVPDGAVILLTGFATIESAAAAVRAGAWAYLVKPCATPDLLLTIEQAMRQVTLLEERRELARRARVTEKLAAVGTLTAGLSHEIRNPLNAALLQLTVLRRRLQRLPEEARGPLLDPLGIVESEIRRLNRILEDFLQFARPRELVTAPVDVAALLGSVLDLLQAEAERAGIHLERGLGAVPPVSGDAGRLQQVLMNLVLNAIQATPAGGRVRVEATVRGDSLVCTVDDSGPGIPVALRQRIFEPFFTTKESGSGLGLPLVHAIIEQHGGAIAIEDSEIGGARLVLHLPLAGEQAST